MNPEEPPALELHNINVDKQNEVPPMPPSVTSVPPGEAKLAAPAYNIIPPTRTTAPTGEAKFTSHAAYNTANMSGRGGPGPNTSMA